MKSPNKNAIQHHPHAVGQSSKAISILHASLWNQAEVLRLTQLVVDLRGRKAFIKCCGVFSSIVYQGHVIGRLIKAYHRPVLGSDLQGWITNTFRRGTRFSFCLLNSSSTSMMCDSHVISYSCTTPTSTRTSVSRELFCTAGFHRVLLDLRSWCISRGLTTILLTQVLKARAVRMNHRSLRQVHQ